MVSNAKPTDEPARIGCIGWTALSLTCSGETGRVPWIWRSSMGRRFVDCVYTDELLVLAKPDGGNLLVRFWRGPRLGDTPPTTPA